MFGDVVSNFHDIGQFQMAVRELRSVIVQVGRLDGINGSKRRTRLGAEPEQHF